MTINPKPNPYRWIVLTLFLCVAGVSQMLWLNFAPLISMIQKQYQVSESTAGLLLLVFPLVYVLLSIPSGSLIDRKGYRYSVNLGAVLMAVFSCTRIWSGHFWLLFISQLGIAIGQPFVVNGISKLVLEWFPKEQTAIATGLGTMGMFIGMALGMALTPALVEQFGFQKTMEIFAAISIFTCMMFLLFAKKNPTHANLDSQEVTIQESFLPLLQNRSLLKVFILAFLGLGFFNGLTTWIEPILAQSGINSEQAGMVGGVLILGGIVGAVVIPGLSDHFKRRKPFLVGSIWIALLTLYPLCTLRTYSGVLCLAIIQGFFFLPAFALLLEVASELAGERLAGSATGILMLFGNAGGVLVILAMEWVKGDGPSFFPAVLLVLAILTIAAGLAGILPETHQRRKVQ